MKKRALKNIDYDRLAFRILILSIVAVLVLAITLLTAWFFNIDFSSGELWLGAIVAFIVVTLIYTAPLYWKIVVIFLSILLVAVFMTQILGLSLFHSLIGGLAVIILILMAILSL